VGLSDVEPLKKAGMKIARKEDGLMIDYTFLRVGEKKNIPTDDERVRKALLMGINRQEIVDQLLNGEGKAVGATLALFSWAFDYKPFDPVPYNPAEAKKLLAAAGYPNGFDMYLYSFTQRLPEISLINETIAGYWDAIGLRTKILEMDYNAFRNIWTKKQEPPGPAAFTMDWPNRPFYSWRGKYHSSSMFSGVNDPALDKMIEAAEAELDLEAYKPKSQAIMQYVIDHGYSSGIATTHELFATSKAVPDWTIGRSFGDYRFEYVGQK
jgi:ABC-type transport system substrate-binding protein